MKFIRKRWRIILISGIALLGIAVFGLIDWAGSEIASPPRRALMGYHHEYLTNLIAHGITIQSFTARDSTPCLVVMPAPSGNLGNRGTIIPQQLIARGVSLDAA